MFTLNNYNISSIYWNPVDFKIVGDQFKLKKTPVTFSNGMSFNLFPFLRNIQDLSFNNKSGIFLTGLKNNNQFIVDNTTPSNTEDLTTIKSVISPLDSNYFYQLSSTSFNLFNLCVSDNFNYNLTDELTFTFIGSQVLIENYYGGVLTNLGNGNNNLIFSPKIKPISNTQLWDYLLGDGKIMLFSYNTGFSSVVINQNNQLILTPYNSQISDDALIVLNSYTNKQLQYNSVKNSFTVKYNSNPILSENSLSAINQDYFYNQNYLGIFPYESINPDGTYDLYFHGLKNYQTTEYRYSTPDDYRQYTKIFSGTNQDKGLNNIYLGYQTNTVIVEFPTNEETGFYFTPTSNPTPISNTGLIEDGAISGSYPYTSDRLFVSQYSQFLELSGFSLSANNTDTHDNNFLCSWLSGSKSSGNKVWCDRYYNSAYYTMDQALSASSMVYNPKLSGNLPFVYDVHSQTVLQPGVYYSYYHVGNEDSINFLEDLKYKYTDSLSYANFLSVSNWLSSGLLDDSPYNNYGLTFGNSGGYHGDYWSLDGSNYAIFQSDNIILEKNNLSTSIWLNVDDWSNIKGYQIFGNYSDSGFGLLNDSDAVAPLMTIINNGSNKVYNLNYKFGVTSTIKVSAKGDFIQRMPDMSYWIFDSVSLTGTKYNVNNIALTSIHIPNISDITQVEIDSKEQIYVYDNTTHSYVIFDTDGKYQNHINDINNNCNRIEIDSNDNVRTDVYGNCSVIDNNNNLWQIIGPNLYKEKDVIATVGASNQMSCDIYNNIWIISNDDSYTKIDSNGNAVFRNSFSKRPTVVESNCPVLSSFTPAILNVNSETSSSDDIVTTTTFTETASNNRIRSINFISVPAPVSVDKNLTTLCGLSAAEYDQFVIVDQTDNVIYLINQNGEPSLKLNLEILLDDGDYINFKTGSDFTGYQNLRKHKKKNALSWYFKTSADNGIFSINHMSYNVSTLSKGWHHFALTFDSNSSATYYIDSIPVKSIKFNSPQHISYDLRTFLLLGATTVKNTILNNVLNLNEGYKFIGSVADLKMYNITLNQNDIEELYYSSVFAPKIKPLKWNMKVGTRNYIEEINQWFQFQLPTNKSKYYNINIHNLQINDNLKKNIELAINNIIGKLSPAHTELNKINWK
jgi:hypothetical protein